MTMRKFSKHTPEQMHAAGRLTLVLAPHVSTLLASSYPRINNTLFLKTFGNELVPRRAQATYRLFAFDGQGVVGGVGCVVAG